jgi:hypothetical protein
MDLQKDSLFVIYLINDHFIFILWLWKLWSVRYNLFNSVFTKVDITLSKGWSLLQVFLSLTYNSSKLYFLWIQYEIIILGDLLSLNFWLFIYLLYLVGHWGNWSLQLYPNLFAVTGQIDKFSFCCILHIMVKSTVLVVKFAKTCLQLALSNWPNYQFNLNV